MLFAKGATNEVKAGRAKRKGISKEKVAEVEARGGELSLAEMLHGRVRYFSEGLAIGNKRYVEGVFKRCRDGLGVKRFAALVSLCL